MSLFIITYLIFKLYIVLFCEMSCKMLVSPFKELKVGEQLCNVYNVPGDGDCFFHCLSLNIHGDFNNTGIFRNLICGSVYNNWSDWAEKVSIYHSQYMTRDLYFEGMINGRWWATACDIEAASNLLDTTINVWLKGIDQQNNRVEILPIAPGGRIGRF